MRAVLLLIASVTLLACSDSSSPTRPKTLSGNQVYVGCQIMVQNRLRSPSSATFPKFGFKDHVTKNGKTYRVDSHVESDNSFGANIRTPWSCEVTDRGGKATDVKLWVDGVSQ